ncbi:hypothetical protein [Egbenema bharatensis]|uniref:hypothetical protein n=1 Tax=Egbenema bharatensis TaxID=3463334 RepID=UPI003A8A376A
MFKTEDYVLHRRFRYSGTVTGYGQRLVDGNYLQTLKVRLASSVMDSQEIIVEDLTSRWIRSNIEDDLKTLRSF